MDFFSTEFVSAIVSIVIMDLVLAGDNAIVIGLAARNLPKNQQKKAIIWGTVGAVIIRIIATLMVVWLLQIPGFLLVGGLLLIKIAHGLLAEKKQHGNVKAGKSTLEAIGTIIIADAVMGIDNVLAVAGAAHGSFLVVVIGLLISIPIVVWGSTLCIQILERYPKLIYLGAAVLAWTAAGMVLSEPFVERMLGGSFVIEKGISLAVVVIILWIGSKQQHAG
jgi:YjbE family integral membrane protein